ncbi:hypothetical protein OXT66_00870 [Lentilactobacillus senioris]|uniref:hypothetical protein n=1 Tax=Lentilactobacillus senioris TaxID=931534 RepID=UPI002281B24D|nr:hypothetical protein [Lentilactobacillus senioris]MCY9806097.1 hypothetical protein [Lentilactobacillus senioris]
MNNEMKQAWNEQSRSKLLAKFQNEAGISVSNEEIAAESEMMYKSELDDNLLPKNTKANLPEQIMVNYYGYNDWVAYVITDMSQDWLLAVGLLYRGKLVQEDQS